MRRQTVGVAAVGIDDFLRIERGGGEVILQIEIFFVQQGAHFFGEGLVLQQVDEAHPSAGGLVLVSRTDAPPCGTDFLVALLGFAGQVDGLVVGHDQMGAFAHLYSVDADVDALAAEIVHFLDQHRWVDHHAVADQAGLALQDTGGNQVADELFTIDHHRVPRIVAALEADDNIGPCRQKVDDLALALVAPLGSDDDDICQN